MSVVQERNSELVDLLLADYLPRPKSGTIYRLVIPDTLTPGFVIVNEDGTIEIAVDTANHRVGIGLDTPTQKLDVNGSVQIREDGTNPGLIMVHGGANLYATIQGPSNRSLRFELRDNGAGDNFEFRNAAGNTILTISREGDLYTDTWQDYSGTSTIQGFASFTQKVIEYKKIGKFVFVNVELIGPAHATQNDVTFSLPYTETHTGGTGAAWFNCMGYDGTWTNSAGYVFGTNARIWKPGSGYVATWTAGGTRGVRGQFWYQA